MKNSYIYIEGSESDISDAITSMLFAGLINGSPRFEGVGANTITLGPNYSVNLTSDEISLPDAQKINGATAQVCELGGAGTRIVKLDSLEYVDGVSVVVKSLQLNFALPAFTQVGRTSDNISYLKLDLPNAVIVSLSALTSFPDFSFLDIATPQLAYNPFTALQTFIADGSEIDLLANAIEAMDIPLLTTLGGTGSAFQISAASLESITFTRLQTITDNFLLRVTSAALADLFLPNISLITGTPSLDFQGCALSNDSLNNLLLRVSTAAQNGSAGSINVSGGTTPAPDATGQTYVSNLLSKGWAITTN